MTRWYRAALLFLILLMPPVCHGAQWQEVGSDSASTTSADVASIKRIGDIVELWSLWNYHEPQSIDGPKFFSVKSKGLFNCTDRTQADADYAMYTERDGLGAIIFESVGPLVFKPVTDGSKAELLLGLACDSPADS